MALTQLLPEHDNLAEYADPALYDVENPSSEPITAFLLQLAQMTGGPALELGCGTGRITIPLAQQGVEMVGLDLVPAMLTWARQKAGHLPIQWIEADARTFHLNRHMGLIFDVGDAFFHLLTRPDHEAILARVRAHLRPDGLFVLSTGFPHLEMLVASEEQAWFSYSTPADFGEVREVQVSGTTHYDAVQQIFHENAIRRWRNADGQAVVREAPLARRRFFPQELDALLHYNGFTTLHRYGDWDASALTDSSPLMIFVCRLRES